ncbi:hypothetical protein F5050DRAFT_1553773, partial [Lentinula boryana]
EVRRFLGMVRFVANHLNMLAEHTRLLTPLTAKDCDKHFPVWTADHDFAFSAVKSLVASSACLTVIDHENMNDNKIFLVTDASDFRRGGV